MYILDYLPTLIEALNAYKGGSFGAGNALQCLHRIVDELEATAASEKSPILNTDQFLALDILRQVCCQLNESMIHWNLAEEKLEEFIQELEKQRGQLRKRTNCRPTE